jgi:hypothetical protein
LAQVEQAEMQKLLPILEQTDQIVFLIPQHQQAVAQAN